MKFTKAPSSVPDGSAAHWLIQHYAAWIDPTTQREVQQPVYNRPGTVVTDSYGRAYTVQVAGNIVRMGR